MRKMTLEEALEKIARLQKRLLKLEALEALGVVDWEGYEDAMDLLKHWEKEE